MIKITNREIIDLVMFDDNKVILVEKHPLIEQPGQFKVIYYIVDLHTGLKEAVTKNTYLRKKFGKNWEIISSGIENFIMCESYVFEDNSVLIVTPTGEIGLFKPDANLKWHGDFNYNECEICGLAIDDNHFWTFCEKQNCIIRYDLDNFKLDLRIGGKKSDTFSTPIYISSDKNNIYISCKDGNVRVLDRTTFNVSDYANFNGELKRYYHINNTSVVCLLDGTYIFDDKETNKE